LTSSRKEEPCVLALHAAATTRALWDEVRRSARGFHLLAPDLAAIARAARGDRDLVIELLAALLPERPVPLAGCGTGANLAVEIAARVPERVSGLLLVNPYPPRPRPRTQSTWRSLLRSARNGVSEDERRSWATLLVNPEGPRFEAAAERTVAMLRAVAEQVHRPEVLDVLDAADIRRQLPALRERIQILFGAARPLPFSDDAREKWIEAVGEERVRSVDRAGYWIPLEEPELIAEALRRLC